ncbi:hypothetical protein JTE90_019495 [Oedothorax gibbosus]|uniref:Uncharacterized protein n=1 Tax=Oedothorax gibbosus TaxID=931172 RepID=A0AAV6UJ11_9ARAC|nr:hypothetical protein JTE90_019495 [Oedothorax gibbosus]
MHLVPPHKFNVPPKTLSKKTKASWEGGERTCSLCQCPHRELSSAGKTPLTWSRSRDESRVWFGWNVLDLE